MVKFADNLINHRIIYSFCFVPFFFLTTFSDEGKGIPKGSKFLGYLYKLATNVVQKEISMLLVYVLTECCTMYFR